VRVTNDLFDAMEGTNRPFAPYLDIGPLKEDLRGEAGRRFARGFVRELPECPAGKDPFGAGVGLPRCRPLGMSMVQAEALVVDSLPGLLDRLPDRYPVSPPPEFADRPRGHGYFIPPVGPARLVLLGVLIALVALGALLGAAFLAGDSRRQTVLWMGWPLLVPAVLIFASGLALLAAAHMGGPFFSVDPLLGPAFARMPQTAEAVYRLVRSVLKRVAAGFLTWGGIALGAAVGLIVWGYLIPRERTV
jgi:hypothetical protein